MIELRVPRVKISYAARLERDRQYAPALLVNVVQHKESERFLEGSTSSVGRTLLSGQHAFNSSHPSAGTPRAFGSFSVTPIVAVASSHYVVGRPLYSIYSSERENTEHSTQMSKS